jgi:hypothetical protein
MHRYQRRWPEDFSNWPRPDLETLHFRDANDVACFAEVDPVLAWRTWPEVWHLDDKGSIRCSSKGSSLDSVRSFAKRPAEMLLCREEPVDPPCPNHWLVIEPRHPGLADQYEVSEEDARAFLRLRRGLTRHGILLLDVMVFDQEFHWWSLHELTSGTTTWTW